MSFTHTPASRVAETGPLSDAERQTRVDLAAAYRLAALNGWDDLIYTHISASVPGSFSALTMIRAMKRDLLASSRSQRTSIQRSG